MNNNTSQPRKISFKKLAKWMYMIKSTQPNLLTSHDFIKPFTVNKNLVAKIRAAKEENYII